MIKSFITQIYFISLLFIGSYAILQDGFVIKSSLLLESCHSEQ
jgi:hypothetical protein